MNKILGYSEELENKIENLVRRVYYSEFDTDYFCYDLQLNPAKTITLYKYNNTDCVIKYFINGEEQEYKIPLHQMSDEFELDEDGDIKYIAYSIIHTVIEEEFKSVLKNGCEHLSEITDCCDISCDYCCSGFGCEKIMGDSI